MTSKQQIGQYAIIRNQKSGLVLDASEIYVKLQHFTGFSPQFWRLEDIDDTKRYIVNKANELYLNIQSSADIGNYIITYRKDGLENSQWIINSSSSDHTLVVTDGTIALDALNGDLTAGNYLIANEKNGGDSQQFILQFES